MKKSKAITSRSAEVDFFLKKAESSRSEFLALYGRRRIGKTYLVREMFSHYNFYFEFTGTKDLKPKLQIQNYLNQLESQFKFKSEVKPKTWADSLNLLKEVILKQKKLPSKKIIFFDELPWLASKKSGFTEALDYFWNSFLSKRKDIMLIVCGSAASWMITNIVNNKAGLHNRMTSPALHLAPFTLLQTKEYFNSRRIDLNEQQILELYMVTGGVAYYLDQYEKGQSAAQFVNEVFFGATSILRDEFDRLFRSLFDKHEIHLEVVKLLSQHSFGLSQNDIIQKLKLKSGGTFTKILDELEKSHFIKFEAFLGNKKKLGVFKLIDEFTHFYLTWVNPLGKSLKDLNYWNKQVGKPKYNSWQGTAFEYLCHKHIDKIKKALGIEGLTTQHFAFYNENTQIDLVIVRSDKTINICEMKYTSDSYVMKEEEAKKIKVRKSEILNHMKTKNQIFTTLITPYPAIRNKNYLGIIDNEINIQAFFKE